MDAQFAFLTARTYPLGGFADRCAPVVDVAGTVFVGSVNHLVYALSPSGALRWSLDLVSPLPTLPALAPDGRLLVGTADGRLVGFHDPPAGGGFGAPGGCGSPSMTATMTATHSPTPTGSPSQ